MARMGVSRRSLLLAISLFFLSLVVVSATGGYGSEYVPVVPKSKPDKLTAVKEMFPGLLGIQGLIYCKSGHKLIPLKDAIARITCLAVDKKGYETAPFSILSSPADAKGYFFATLSPSELENGCKLTKCKAFLEKSPLNNCKVPTDVNKGKTGALLAPSRLLENMKLYSVGPFVYTSESASPVGNGY